MLSCTYHHKRPNTVLFGTRFLLLELFSLAVSNAKLKQIFSLMKRIKTDGRTSLSKKTLSTLIQICMEGAESEFFDPISTMTL